MRGTVEHEAAAAPVTRGPLRATRLSWAIVKESKGGEPRARATTFLWPGPGWSVQSPARTVETVSRTYCLYGSYLRTMSEAEFRKELFDAFAHDVRLVHDASPSDAELQACCLHPRVEALRNTVSPRDQRVFRRWCAISSLVCWFCWCIMSRRACGRCWWRRFSARRRQCCRRRWS